MIARLRPRSADEAGAIMILYGLLLVVMFTIAAIVIDLAALRQDARASQTVADVSATAGAAALDPLYGGSPYKGCQAAFGYFVANTPGVPTTTPDPCAPLLAQVLCTASTAPTSVSTSVGAYTVTIKTPVPDSDLNHPADWQIDGAPCERISVKVDRTRGYIFGTLIGGSGSSTFAKAVARGSSGGSFGELVSLVLLDPVGCNALIATGQGEVRVNPKGPKPGIITVDSNGSLSDSNAGARRCFNAQDYTIDAQGEQNSKIRALDALNSSGDVIARAVIFSHALYPGEANARSYDPNDLNLSTPVDGRLYPRPSPGRRITRSPIDWRYNCKPSNGCPHPAAPYIDNLRAAVGTTGLPSGFTLYTGPCSTQSSDPPIVVPAGNWYVNCPSNPKGFDVQSSITFLGGNIVFEGKVNVGGSGVLCINVGAGTCGAPQQASDVWVYVRNGDFVKDAQATLTLPQTFLHLYNGVITFGAGDKGALRWSAPFGGTFEDLALWSESSLQHDLGGQAVLNIEGSFFAPNASPFKFTGQGCQQQTKAQFITFRMEVGGQGCLIMEPDPDRIVPIPLQGIRLVT
jgi:hypothetical protein